MYIEDNKITVKQDTTSEKKTEMGCHSNIRRKLFFQLIKEHDIQVEKIILRRTILVEFYKLNYFLKMIKHKYNFQIKESMLFLEEEYDSFRKILKLLDDENKYDLIWECSDNNVRIKVEKTKLLNFLQIEESFD